MATVEITHTRAEGTLLEGSIKGDGVFEIVRKHGFWSSRTLGCLYIRHSRDKEAKRWQIDAAVAELRAAGHEVTVTINEDERRTFAEAEADREERAEDRAGRFAERAGRAVASADARRATADQISKRFEFGQPILVGHHSEGRARRDAARIDSNMRKSFEERDRAGYWASRSGAAENYAKHRKNPGVTLRRLERLRAELRAQERHHAEAVGKGYSSVDRHAREIRDYREEIEYWEAIIEKAKADGVKVWGPDDFAPGDFVLYSSSWYQVARVNPKTLSIAWNLRLAPKQVMSLEDATFDGGRIGTHTADYSQVRARCPEAAMTAFLAEGKVPGTKSARAASDEQPASAVREAQAAEKAGKKKAPKKKADPKVAKRVHVACAIGGREATLTWLNGNSRPHKDFEPVTITAKEGEAFHRAVWSRPLQVEIARALGEHGYECGEDGWVLSRARDGFVRNIQPKLEEAPETPQPEEPVAAVDEQPAPEPAIEEQPAVEPSAGDVDEDQAPGDAPSEEPGEDPAGAEKTGSDLRFLPGNPVPQGSSGVSHSVYPLNPTPHSERPDTMTDTATTTATKAVESAPAKKAPAKVATKKAPAKQAPAKGKVVEPTKVSKRREVVAEQAAETREKTKTVQRSIPTDRIDRDPSQPREEFDQAKLEELAGSMRKLGQLQPISVRYVPATRRYMLIMGERRWRAAQMAGLTEMTALVLHGVEEGARETLAKQVAENVGRADMTAMEEAKSFRRLEKAEYTVDEIAEMCGKSAAYVGWRLDLLRLCEPAQEALGKGHLPVGMAWYVSQLSCDNQLRFLSKYARGAFANDRDAEAFVKAARAEEQRRESQGSFFVLADESTGKSGDVQELIPGAHDVPEEERERITAERSKLTKKIERLSTAGEILAELATADPEELALLLAGTGGGVAAHLHRMEHLRGLTTKVIKNLRDAQAIAAVRAGAIEVNPAAVAS
ncbi:ParB/RepB/Spo0J family partition protein [Streptomyces murinus]|uniref:ParB/RepB/Spo0J family partition protein n=1 Tax=Streptomyces murinus TaxID=33900 RepID=UPI001F348F2B|nr:ParB/RepB/Spo0J family partition protein [Streptomyces murinus]